mmetsp:Transcript_35180/g.84885  ORF Transcript_35180/g.84885 Transcript_35180/m.84885 type:complete len:230 (-) Transcript_35180:12-701(-)|eukprot:CAMPEP_0181085844 /NCGR_PEP_ID=MMETSP1071-20121207/5438_1 /TAXON_ID=35127 /ORGANISM="Thalassiosira sp., Strain NH16" /LENGTH=229 /DNA_ID=CAMNT_0023167657 /DNA_START=70 /DNA_END=759 /DNA_ORIENTATION=-
MAQSEKEASDRLRQTPLSWSELQAIILSPNDDDLSKLARSEEQTKTYRLRRAEIKSEWESIYDYLLCAKFGFEWVWAAAATVASADSSGEGDNTQRRRKRSRPSFQEYADEQKLGEREVNCTAPLNLSLNDFPYYLAPGIQHFVLWKLGGWITPEEIAKAKSDILKGSRSPETTNNTQRSHCIGGKDNLDQILNDRGVFLYWINPPHLKSLPGIDHVHILFRGEGISRL